MSADVPLIFAFVAGLFSVASPCVLPLVPIYLAHLAGVSAGEVGTARGKVLGNAVAYVLGFSVVFVAVGVALGAAGGLVATASVVASQRDWLVRLGGVLLVVLGAHQLGLLRLPFLAREWRFAPDAQRGGSVASSFLVGVTFAAGWSPCVGPILGAILTLAAGQGNPERAAVLLTAYSAGLAVPFVLAAVAYGSSRGLVARLNPHLATLARAGGGVMLAMGTIMLLGFYQQFFARLVAAAPWLPWEPKL